jgi:hypothetical protein
MARTAQRVAQDQDSDEFVPYEERGDKFNIPQELIPDGMVYQWVRAFYMGKEDNRNISISLRNRWTYVPADRPGHEIIGFESTEPDVNGRRNPHEGHILLEGLVLMERSAAIQKKVTNTVGARDQRMRGEPGLQQKAAKDQLRQGLAAAKAIPDGHLGGKERVVTFNRHRDLSIPEDFGADE